MCGEMYHKAAWALFELTMPRPILSPHNTQRIPYSLITGKCYFDYSQRLIYTVSYQTLVIILYTVLYFKTGTNYYNVLN